MPLLTGIQTLSSKDSQLLSLEIRISYLLEFLNSAYIMRA